MYVSVKKTKIYMSIDLQDFCFQKYVWRKQKETMKKVYFLVKILFFGYYSVQVITSLKI